MEYDKLKKYHFVFVFYALLAGCIYWLSQNLNHLPLWFDSLSNKLLPLTLGCAMAFVINIPTAFLEAKLFTKRWGQADKWRLQLKRPLSLLLSLCFFALMFYAFFALLLPEVNVTIERLSLQLPGAIQATMRKLEAYVQSKPRILELAQANNINLNDISRNFISGYDSIINTIVSRLSNMALSLLNGFITAVLGLIFGIYIILSKEKLAQEITRGLYAYFPENKVDSFLKLMFFSSSIFSRYISAQCLEAGILGFLIFGSLSLFKIPYAVLIAVVIALFALIPIFGAYISAAIGFLLVLTVESDKALLYIVIVLVVQQIEGNIIYPFVVGSQMGLPAVWVFAAVVIGGNFFGLYGLILSVPICSVVYILYCEYSSSRVQKRQINEQKLREPANYFQIDSDLQKVMSQNEQDAKKVDLSKLNKLFQERSRRTKITELKNRRMKRRKSVNDSSEHGVTDKHDKVNR